MTVLVSDSFNRANNTTTLGTTDSYNGGTAKTWTSATTYGINNNQAQKQTGSATANSSAWIDSVVSDGKATITFATLGNHSKLIFRRTDDGNWLGVLANGTTNYQIIARQNSSNTVLASIGVVPANGDVVSATFNGSSITVTVNGANSTTVTSTFNQTATQVGILTDDSVARFDNFEVDDLNTGTNLSVSLSDNISAVDSLTKSVSLYENLADSLTATDSLVSTRNLHLSFSDTINSTDSLVSSKNLHISLSDTIGTTDSISSLIQQVINLAKTVIDTISLTDSITVTKNKYLTLVDLFTLVDSIGIGGGVMSQVIQIRRGHEANLPVLNVGEPALTTDTQKMFIGTPNGNIEIPTLLVVSSVSSLPTPSVSNQWMLAGVKGGTGVADAMYMCKKLSNDTYDWVQFV